MAEHSKGGILNKAEKILRRRKTKVLQSLGKTGRTVDDELESQIHKLEGQQEVANKFQKDLRQFMTCARAMSAAAKTFYATLDETYEAEWTEQTQVHETLQGMELLWTDYISKLQEHVQDPLSKYMNCIPQIKARISKRGRKLTDYDNARHNLEVQQNAKKKDEAKINKAQEDLNEAKKIYEDLNNDLHNELPTFYNSRITFYAKTFESLFSAQDVFHGEVGKMSASLGAIAERLGKENEQFVYEPKRPPLRSTLSTESDEPAMPNGHSENGNSGYDSHGDGQTSQPESPRDTEEEARREEERQIVGAEAKMPDEPVPASEPTEDAEYVNAAVVNGNLQSDEKTSQDKEEGDKEEEKIEAQTSEKVASQAPVTHDIADTAAESDAKPEALSPAEDDQPPEVPDYPPPKPPSPLPDVAPTTNGPVNGLDVEKDAEVHEEDDLYQVPSSNKPVDDYPPGFLYLVVATHAYTGEDTDELTFEKDELIYVVEYDDPDEQDEGWLMGVKKSDKQKGVFPQNFTKKLKVS